MRPAVKSSLKFLERAARALDQSDSTTVEETVAMIKAVAAIRGRVMILGDRARRALVQQQALEEEGN